MAWHIPLEMRNCKPLDEEVVRAKFKAHGYEIIEYCYKNNRTKIPCYDSEGYIVMVSYDSLRQNNKVYARFSPSCNEKYFMYNLGHYRELHPEVAKVLDWEYILAGKAKKKQVRVLCKCNECGNLFWTSLHEWREAIKNRCNDCVFVKSGLEKKTEDWLIENDIVYFPQYKFEGCKDKRCLPFDFYLPYLNICIEVDGEQHFKTNRYFKNHIFTENDLKEIQRKDKIKTDYCNDNGIKLIRLNYLNFHSNTYKEILEKEILNQ